MRCVPVLFILAAAAAGSAGCATMANGPNQKVLITSEPAGAQVTVLSDKPSGPRVIQSNSGVTPVKVSLPRRDANIVIRLEKEGCPPAQVRLTRTVSGWTAGNLVLANPYARQGLNSESQYWPQLLATAAGFGIDVLAGGAFKLPETVHATLGPAASPCAPVLR